MLKFGNEYTYCLDYETLRTTDLIFFLRKKYCRQNDCNYRRLIQHNHRLLIVLSIIRNTLKLRYYIKLSIFSDVPICSY